jgi:hypothetical protein
VIEGASLRCRWDSVNRSQVEKRLWDNQLEIDSNQFLFRKFPRESCNHYSSMLTVSPTDRVFILTGAGVSAESGIPTFRGVGWKKRHGAR